MSAYNTIEAAADMVALRKALGIDRWVPYGVSYGTRVALQLTRTDPDGIEAVVLDSVYPLHIRGWADSLPVLDRRLKDLFEACRDQADCRNTYGDLDAMFVRVMKSINDSPVPLTLRDEYSDNTMDLKADGDDLIAVLEYTLLMSDWLEYIPLLIDQIDHKDYQLFTIAAEQIVFDDYYETDANGLTYSTQCHEEMAVNPPEAFAAGRDAFPFPTATDFELSLRLACKVWDVGDVDPSFLEPVESNIPTLILSGAYDPRTPYEWAMEQVERLKNGHLALLLNAGHGPSVTDACAQAAIAAFLDSPVKYMPPGCLNRQRGPQFLAAPGPPDLVL